MEKQNRTLKYQVTREGQARRVGEQQVTPPQGGNSSSSSPDAGLKRQQLHKKYCLVLHYKVCQPPTRYYSLN